MDRDVVIGLDLATQTGWAAYTVGYQHLGSGAWDISGPKGEHIGARLVRLRANLDGLLGAYRGRVVLVSVEDVYSSPTMKGGRSRQGKHSGSMLWRYRGIAEMVAAEHGAPVVAYAQSTLKLHYARSGNASIEQVIAIADAEFPLTTPPGRSKKLRGDEAMGRAAAVTAIAKMARK